LLKPKQRYDLERMQAEHERIEAQIENFGLYYFDDRYLIFEADSTVGEKQVDLDLRLEPGIPQRAKRIFRLNEVNVYPNYVLSTDTLAKSTTKVVNGFNYIDNAQKFRPSVITRVINLHKGDIYSREAQDLTLSHLMDLGTFKFVNIKFRDVTTDSSRLDANIYLTPLKKKSIRAEAQAVSKSNNFVGPGLSLTFTNRNFLKGAELFQLKLNTSYEIQISKRVSGPLNSFELGLESSLTVPRFISPIRIDYSSRKYLPKTQIKLAFNLQNRVDYFRLNSFNLAYGYNWRETASKTHELFPIDINYVRTDKKSPDFETLLAGNTVLANSFEDQFIVGSRYTYTLNTQLNENPLQKFEEKKIRVHSFYFSATADVAGNLLHAIQEKAHRSTEGPFRLLGSPYSQYIRGDVDFRYYWQMDEQNKLATRLVLGTGYAYGNSETLPYIKQFSIGGSNSIRAFPARSVGPGTYDVRSEENEGSAVLFIDQRGDIKLEGNVEYRFDIIKSFKGAVFVDAGNIWLLKEDPDRPGGKFRRSTFLDELAVGTGLGFRFDFSFFVLRVDIAFPLRKPFLPPNERWVIDQIDFGSPSWRSDNLIFNIAIGYPF
jgi:outer membrane protein assembly factor BamA